MNILYPAAKAEEKFENARRRVFIRELLGLLTRHHPKELLSYEDVRARLGASDERAQGTQMIELNKIVGSVGRYRDFTREFLPRAGVNRDRWKRIDMALNRLEDLPPIEVYKIGDVYFVKDGNHRVSVARANGLDDIEAIVTEVQTKVPLTPDVDPNDLILKEEYANFLEKTHLDELRPKQHIVFTTPGRYRTLLEHIAVHRHFMGLSEQREIPYPEAVVSWYDHVYKPAVEAIRREGILKKFPGRTEADLYVWLMDHLQRLKEEYGDDVTLEAAAAALADEAPETGLARLAEPVKKMVDAARDAAEPVKKVVDIARDAVGKVGEKVSGSEEDATPAEPLPDTNPEAASDQGAPPG